MTDQFETLLDQGCGEISLTLSPTQKEQFFQYYELLIEWNRFMNLTAITELPDVVTKHFLDSLLLVKAFPEIGQHPLRLIDVGTGAGFPGIPLKIAFPEVRITLLDSLNKRINFLNEVIDHLKLSGIETIHGRAEDAARKEELREKFQVSVSRAVANLSTLSEYCIPFLEKGGTFISYKSGGAEEEIMKAQHAVQKLGGEMKPASIWTLPGTDVERSFILIRKIGTTPKKYPRKAGTPSKEPLE